MDGGRLAGTITLAQAEKEMAEGHGDRVLGELLPVDVPNPLLTSESFPHLHMDHPLDMALRRMAHSKLNVLPVVGRADIRDLKGVVSLQDILQAYGVAGEKGAAPAASEEVRASRRLVPGVIAAGLAVLLVIGFLNYYYRSARSRARRAILQDAATSCCSRTAMTKRCSSSATHFRERRGIHNTGWRWGWLWPRTSISPKHRFI